VEDSERWKIRTRILRKLFNMRKIGGSHTEARNAIKGLDPELTNPAQDELKWLIKNGFLLSKPSTGEVHVSINPRMLKEVHKLVGGDIK